MVESPYHTIALHRDGGVDRYLKAVMETFPELRSIEDAIAKIIIQFDPDWDLIMFKGEK